MVNLDPIRMFRAERANGSFFYFHARHMADAEAFCHCCGEQPVTIRCMEQA